MGTDLIFAVVSAVVSFVIFLKLFSILNRAFNIEMPGWLIFILCLIIAFVLYYKRDIFFSIPIATGATIGFIISILWNVRDTFFSSGSFNGMFLLRFVLWAGVIALGIYKREIFLDLWNKQIVVGNPSLEPYLLILAILIFIAGSIFILFPRVLIRKRGRSTGFSMVRRTSKSGTVFVCILGLLLTLISSTLLIEAYNFFINKAA